MLLVIWNHQVVVSLSTFALEDPYSLSEGSEQVDLDPKKKGQGAIHYYRETETQRHKMDGGLNLNN